MKKKTLLFIIVAVLIVSALSVAAFAVAPEIIKGLVISDAEIIDSTVKDSKLENCELIDCEIKSEAEYKLDRAYRNGELDDVEKACYEYLRKYERLSSVYSSFTEAYERTVEQYKRGDNSYYYPMLNAMIGREHDGELKLTLDLICEIYAESESKTDFLIKICMIQPAHLRIGYNFVYLEYETAEGIILCSQDFENRVTLIYPEGYEGIPSSDECSGEYEEFLYFEN